MKQFANFTVAGRAVAVSVVSITHIVRVADTTGYTLPEGAERPEGLPEPTDKAQVHFIGGGMLEVEESFKEVVEAVGGEVPEPKAKKPTAKAKKAERSKKGAGAAE